MEKAKQDAFDSARLEVIRDAYERAFECINTGLTVDEAGDKPQALELYKRGRQHLLRGISVPSRGEECVGSSWESARQMQRKMQETLNNITTRLAIIETSSDLESAAALGYSSVSDPGAEKPLYPKLPSQSKPERPAPPNALSAKGQEAGAVGGKAACSSEGLPLSPSRQPVVPAEQPPAYSPQAADGHLSVSYGTETGEMSLVGDEYYSRTSNSTPSLQSLGEDGEELVYIPHGVQIFFVTPEGQVSAPSYPGYLRLVKFTGDHDDRMPNRPPAFLQVCDWLYPLMAMDSPVLLCNTGVFMFPDMMAPTPGYYVGVVLSSELPAADRQLFQELLSQNTDLRVQPPDEAADTINLSQKVSIVAPEETAAAVTEEEEEKALPEWSEKVSNGILTGASWLSWGLVKGAEFTGIAIHKGASKLREHITPEDRPTHINPTVTKGLHVAKQATGGAVKVSQFLVDGVCMVAGCVGRELAPHVKKHGGKLIPESMKKDKDGRSNIDGAMVVAASGVQGFATMWTGLEVAAKDITASVASETVTTVKHKYGAAAGQATDHAVNSAINVGLTAFNVDNLGIKAVVKRTGKQTAKTILEDYKLQVKPESSKQVEKSSK
ncbi:spart [Pungitius sinensis]